MENNKEKEIDARTEKLLDDIYPIKVEEEKKEKSEASKYVKALADSLSTDPEVRKRGIEGVRESETNMLKKQYLWLRVGFVVNNYYKLLKKHIFSGEEYEKRLKEAKSYFAVVEKNVETEEGFKDNVELFVQYEYIIDLYAEKLKISRDEAAKIVYDYVIQEQISSTLVLYNHFIGLPDDKEWCDWSRIQYILSGHAEDDINVFDKEFKTIDNINTLEEIREYIIEAQCGLGQPWVKRTCKECGEKFSLTFDEVQWYNGKGFKLPRTCKYCKKGIERPKKIEPKKVSVKKDEAPQKTAMQLAMEKSGII